jgi:hypothetical protein
MTDDEIEIKTVPLYFTEPKLGTELYAWGAISTYKMSKAEYDEMFGPVTPMNKPDADNEKKMEKF